MRFRMLFPLFAAIALVAAACGDGASAQEKYCEAGQSLESSVNALSGAVGVDDVGQVMDLVAERGDDLESAIDAVRGDLDALREAATDAAADEVDAFEQAMDDITDAFSELGGDVALDNAVAAQDAVQRLGMAAQAVYGTLTDCP